MKLRVFIFVLLFSSVSVFAQSKDETALRSLVNQMSAAQTNFDPVTLDKIYTADYIEISPLGEFDPREKVLGFYKPELKPPADKMSVKKDLDEYSIRSYGNLAIVILRLNFTITSDAKTQPPRSLRITLVCRKEKGAWKIASAQYTGIRPPQVSPKSS